MVGDIHLPKREPGPAVDVVVAKETLAVREEAVELAPAIPRYQLRMQPRPACRLPQMAIHLADLFEQMTEQIFRVGVADRSIAPERQLPEWSGQCAVMGQAVVAAAQFAPERACVGAPPVVLCRTCPM